MLERMGIVGAVSGHVSVSGGGDGPGLGEEKVRASG